MEQRSMSTNVFTVAQIKLCTEKLAVIVEKLDTLKWGAQSGSLSQKQPVVTSIKDVHVFRAQQL